METHDSTSGLLLVHGMTLKRIPPLSVPALTSMLILPYPPYLPLLVMTISVRLVYQLGVILLTPSGMEMVVDPLVPAVPSTTHHGSVNNLLNPPLMTLR